MRAARAKIRADRQRASPEVAELLVVVEKRVDDPSFDVNALKRTCRPSRETLACFALELGGLLPKAYLLQRRMEILDRLVVETDAPAAQLAPLLGYSVRQSVARAYKDWSGKTIEDRRAEADAEAAAAAEPDAPAPAPAAAEPLPLALWRRLVLGRVEPAAGEAEVRRLRARYGAVIRGRRATRPGCVLEPSAELAQPLAEAVWTAATAAPASSLAKESARPAEGALSVPASALRHVLRFRSPALFHLLGHQSAEAGGGDGVALAELALEVLEESADAFGDALGELRALAWARIARARRRARDFPGAEQALAFCDEEWAAPQRERDPAVEAEIHDLKASQHLAVRRFDAACELVDRVIEACRGGDQTPLLVRALVRRAGIARRRGDARTAVALLEETRQLIAHHEEPELLLAVDTDLVMTHAAAGNSREAAAALPRARTLCAALGDPLHRSRLTWAEALIRQQEGDEQVAEDLLVEAKAAFLELDEKTPAALVCLDLAELYRRRREKAKLTMLLAETVAIVESLRLHRDVLAAARLLRSALERKKTTRAVLRQARAAIEAVHGDCGAA